MSEREALRNTLIEARRYMRHDPGCDVAGVPRCMTDKSCNCGMDEVMQIVRDAIDRLRE